MTHRRGLAKPGARKKSVAARQITRLRRRLSPDPDKPLSQQRFSDLLRVSWSTVARWEGGGRPDRQVTAKLARLSRALDALGDMLKPEHRLAFFEERHPLLLNLRPIDLLDTDEGAETVSSLLRGAESGAFA